jgi:hypothetical protein
MSWSASITIPKGSNDDEAAYLIEQASVSGNDDCPKERDAQVEEAKLQARQLLFSEAPGQVGACAWEIFLSGHANPGHEQRREWSSERVSVAVQQQTLGPVTQIAAGEAGKGGDK